QIRDGRSAVLATVGKQHLHLKGAVLHRGCEVLDRHERQRRQPERLATYLRPSGRRSRARAASPSKDASARARCASSTRQCPLPDPPACERMLTCRPASSSPPCGIHHVTIG